MLTACTKSGKKLSLGYPYKKETLLSLRSREEFFCPLCGERVFLKLGDQKIYHFAHQKGGSCREFYENETEYHMQGKLKLFRWLKRQRIPAVLEFYDKKIKQRPDILFYYQNHKFALEYQCSAISEAIFTERTATYLQNGYIPLWIIGENNLKEDFSHMKGLTDFHYLFLRKSSIGQFFIPSFSPDSEILHVFYSIFPYSVKNTSIQKLSQPLAEAKLAFLLDPPMQPRLNQVQWKKMSEKYISHWSLYPNPQQRKFLNEIYRNHLNLFLFPPEIGVPVSHAFLLRTPPFIWQAYYYLDILSACCPGQFISREQIKKSLAGRMRDKDILPRTIPQIENLHPLAAFVDYTNFLVGQKVLAPTPNGLLQIQKTIEIPQTNREKEERNASFYSRNSFKS